MFSCGLCRREKTNSRKPGEWETYSKVKEMASFFDGDDNDYLTRAEFVEWCIRVCHVETEETQEYHWMVLCRDWCDMEDYEDNKSTYADYEIHVERFIDFVLNRDDITLNRMLRRFSALSIHDKLPEKKEDTKESDKLKTKVKVKFDVVETEEKMKEEEKTVTDPSSAYNSQFSHAESSTSKPQSTDQKSPVVPEFKSPSPIAVDENKTDKFVDSQPEPPSLIGGDGKKIQKRASIEIKEKDENFLQPNEEAKTREAAVSTDSTITYGELEQLEKNPGMVVARLICLLASKTANDDSCESLYLRYLTQTALTDEFKDAVEKLIESNPHEVKKTEIYENILKIAAPKDKDDLDKVSSKVLLTAGPQTLFKLTLSAHLVKTDIFSNMSPPFIRFNQQEDPFFELEEFDSQLAMEIERQGLYLDKSLDMKLETEKGAAIGSMNYSYIVGAEQKIEVPLRLKDNTVVALVVIHNMGIERHFLRNAQEKIDMLSRKDSDQRRNGPVILSIKSNTYTASQGDLMGVSFDIDPSNMPTYHCKLDKKLENSMFRSHGQRWVKLHRGILIYASQNSELTNDKIALVETEFRKAFESKSQKLKLKKGVSAIHVSQIQSMKRSSSGKGITLMVQFRKKERPFTFEPHPKNGDEIYSRLRKLIKDSQDILKVRAQALRT